MAGRQLLDAAQPRPAGHVLQGQVGVELRGVDLTAHAGQLQERLHLGGECERAVLEPRVDERLLAHVVAREDEPLARRVPERDREHPGEAVGELEPVLLVQMRDHGRVAGAADVVPGQLHAQLAEVVELAVEDGDDVAGLVRDRLAARLEVDHPQAAVAEHAAAERVDGALVRAPVDERRVHAGDERGIGRSARRHEPADPAHGGSL